MEKLCKNLKCHTHAVGDWSGFPKAVRGPTLRMVKAKEEEEAEGAEYVA